MTHKKLGTVVESGNGNKATKGQVSGDLFVTFFYSFQCVQTHLDFLKNQKLFFSFFKESTFLLGCAGWEKLPSQAPG